jgi:hypothetical protein
MLRNMISSSIEASERGNRHAQYRNLGKAAEAADLWFNRNTRVSQPAGVQDKRVELFAPTACALPLPIRRFFQHDT